MNNLENAGYFEESLVRETFRRVGNPIAEQRELDLTNPTIQRKVARMSIMRAMREHDDLGGIVKVFSRLIPYGSSQMVRITWTTDLDDPQHFERLKELYNYLVDWESKKDSEEIVHYLDDFMRGI